MAYTVPTGNAYRQGDILANVRTFSLDNFAEGGTPEGTVYEYSNSIIVTQDCDLEQDYTARFPEANQSVSPDKLLFGITLCGAYPEDVLKAGKHRPRAKEFGRKEWKPVIQNLDPRYQYLGYVPPAGGRLVVDFKDYFMVPSAFLYNEMEAGRVTRICEMKSPWKEHLLQRFAWYLMRVGLPIEFEKLPVEKNGRLAKSC